MVVCPLFAGLSARATAVLQASPTTTVGCSVCGTCASGAGGARAAWASLGWWKAGRVVPSEDEERRVKQATRKKGQPRTTVLSHHQALPRKPSLSCGCE